MGLGHCLAGRRGLNRLPATKFSGLIGVSTASESAEKGTSCLKYCGPLIPTEGEFKAVGREPV